MLGTEFERLHAEIERKENEIDEKDRALRDLLRRHDELIDKAQQDAAHNSNVIEYLNENKQALSQLVKQGQGELKASKEDKRTFKSALDVIVGNDSRLKRTFLKKTVILQRKVALEQSKFSALEQTLERKSSDYEEKIQSLIQEKLDFEQKVTQLHDSARLDQNRIDSLEAERRVLESKVEDMAGQINILENERQTWKTLYTLEEKALFEKRSAEMTEQMSDLRKEIEQQRKDFEEKENALQVSHDAKVDDLKEEIRHFKEKIQILEESRLGASGFSEMVSNS